HQGEGEEEVVVAAEQEGQDGRQEVPSSADGTPAPDAAEPSGSRGSNTPPASAAASLQEADAPAAGSRPPAHAGAHAGNSSGGGSDDGQEEETTSPRSRERGRRRAAGDSQAFGVRRSSRRRAAAPASAAVGAVGAVSGEPSEAARDIGAPQEQPNGLQQEPTQQPQQQQQQQQQQEGEQQPLKTDRQRPPRRAPCAGAVGGAAQGPDMRLLDCGPTLVLFDPDPEKTRHPHTWRSIGAPLPCSVRWGGVGPVGAADVSLMQALAMAPRNGSLFFRKLDLAPAEVERALLPRLERLWAGAPLPERPRRDAR
ncbi:hypothetical protein MNEG_6547, partial [Monoraphidium neglectum]